MNDRERIDAAQIMLGTFWLADGVNELPPRDVAGNFDAAVTAECGTDPSRWDALHPLQLGEQHYQDLKDQAADQ